MFLALVWGTNATIFAHPDDIETHNEILNMINKDPEVFSYCFHVIYNGTEFYYTHLTLRQLSSGDSIVDVVPNLHAELMLKNGDVLATQQKLFEVFEADEEDFSGLGHSDDVVGFPFDFCLPYNEDASEVNVYIQHEDISNGEKILVLSFLVSHLDPKDYLLCNEDYMCNNDETYEICPTDCLSGSNDGICDGEQDDMCDPDCSLLEDLDCSCGNDVCDDIENKINCPQDCKKNYWLLIIIGIGLLVLMVIILYFVRANNLKKL